MSAFVGAGYNKTDFAHMTLTSRIIFRRNTNNLIDLCKRVDLPIVILSGGITELIEASLKILKVDEADKTLDHVKIISNEFFFPSPLLDEVTPVIGFRKPPVHPSSKQKVLYDHFKLKLPKNLIVMGDIIADSRMARDHLHDHIVKVGFYNAGVAGGHCDVSFDEFSKHFDIVITGDGTLCPILYTVASLFAGAIDKATPEFDEARQLIDGFKGLEEVLKGIN